MSIANRVDSGALAAAPQPARSWRRTPWWERPAMFPLRLRRLDLDRLADRRSVDQSDLLHVSDENRGRLLRSTVSGELPYFLGQSLEVMVYGLVIAIAVGIPLGIAMARFRRLDWALDLPINALYATPSGRRRAAAGAVVRHLSEGQDHRRVPVRGVPGPDQHLSGRARMRQEHARGGALVPLQRVADVAGRAAAVSRCPTSSPAYGLPSAAG